MNVVVPSDPAGLLEFVHFAEDVYSKRGARWNTNVPYALSVLNGTSAATEGRMLRPMFVEDNGKIVARVLAVVDEPYMRRWNEKLGHLCWFEALPGTQDATRLLINEACEWLRTYEVEAARAGFGFQEYPFVVDDCESLPPPGVRANPMYYHGLLKGAGFEVERGFLDYKAPLTPEHVPALNQLIATACQEGYEFQTLENIAANVVAEPLADLWNATLGDVWGSSPTSSKHMFEILVGAAMIGMTATSALAYHRDTLVGFVFAAPFSSLGLKLANTRVLRDDEMVNRFFSVGVSKEYRRSALAWALGAFAQRALIIRGGRFLSYGLTQDSNWHARRGAEHTHLSYVSATYLVYRRDFKSGMGKMPGAMSL